tara:strand:+ start:2776 stop:3288 length:513 start_codon:yes stop_codon:yes gene_type:complete
MSETIILVDKQDNQIGTIEKLPAHEQAVLHRAFSLYIFNKKGELLIQKRNRDKYHSGTLWSNTCCSHPRHKEGMQNAIHRRLEEEFGIDTEMNEIFSTIYKCKFDNGLSEHEYLHVFIGYYDGEVNPSPTETEDYKWIKPKELLEGIKNNPEKYSYWLKDCIDRVLKFVK